MSKGKEIVDKLVDRKGFDDWWYGIDNEIQEEIVAEIDAIIEQANPVQGHPHQGCYQSNHESAAKWNALYKRWEIPDPKNAAMSIEVAPPAITENVIHTIGDLLANAMNAAVADGADSRSMPDDYVELAQWIAVYERKKVWLVQTPQSIYQYYYKNDDCHAYSPISSNCICWHDEGTGPDPAPIDARRTWRKKP